MAQNSIVDSTGLFKLDTLLDLEIKSYSYYEVGLKKFVVVANEDELIFLFISPQGDKTEKRYGWDFSLNNINCMCFEPTGTWILIVSDQKMFIAPFLPLFIPHQSYDYKWSLTDLTVIPLTTVNKPTAVVWWLTKESENVVIVGSQTGSLLFFSLDAKRILGETKIPDAVVELQICIDDSLDLLVLLVTGAASQQWKLVLEYRSLCYNWIAHNATIQDKEKKEGFMSYIRQLSKDKMSIFSQSTSKDKTQNVEYTAKPVEYLPQFRKGSNNWALSVQYVNGRHFLTAFETNEGTMILESTEEETPTRTFMPEIGKQGGYLQGLWSQRLIYVLKKNGLEVHSSSLSLVQDPTMVDGSKRWTVLWDVELNGDALKAYVLTAREPTPEAEGWYEPTFTCDLQLPRFTMEPCLVITTKGVYLLSTLTEPAEWLVGMITRGGLNAEEWAAALAAPMPQLLRAAADLLLSRGKVAPAQYLYSLSQSKTDGWIARLGVFGRLQELVAYKSTGHNVILSNAAIVMKILAQLLKIAIDDEKIELDKKFLNLSQQELQELSSFAAAVGLWDLLPSLTVHQGYTDLFLSSILHKSVYCRGAFHCLIRQKHVVPLLLEDNGLTLLAYIREHCGEFDMRLLKRMCLWLCPLQDQLRPVLRDLRQGIVNKYTTSMEPLIHTFVKLLCAIEEKEPCPEIDTGTQKDSETWKEQFVPRRVLSCGLSHWALADSGEGKVMWANTPVKTPLIGRVISVACGRHHTLILTENGIYGAGDNSYGQLGVGAAWGGITGDSAGTGGGLFHVTRTWQAPIADISAGHYHSAAIDVGGRLYTWGWAVHGQLGLGTIDDEWSPKLVTKLQGRKVINVTCGSCHTLALMKNGEVWAWGAGVFGQLGSGARDKASVPQRVVLADPVDAIAAGYFHNLALTCKGHLYVWGASPQLIRAAHARRSLSPTEPASPPPSDQPDQHLLPTLVDIKNVRGTIVQIAAGWHHSCLIDDTGAVYTWGLNFDGQLGSGDRKQVCVPTEVRIDTESPPESMNNENLTSIKPFIASKTNIVQRSEGEGVMNSKSLIACGGDFTIYVDKDGRVFITGNMHQQATTEGGKSCNRVIMMKTTKRVIKIPANRNCNKYLFQPVDRLDLIFNSKFSETKRNEMEPHANPLITLADFKRKSWVDEVIVCLKRWIKEEYVNENKNIAAKLAYHNGMYPECLKYLLETLNREDVTESLYLKHTDDSSNCDSPSGSKKEDVKATVNIVTSKRIKEIGLTILNEQPYPVNSALVLAVLPCCCDELKYFSKKIPHTQTYFVHETGPLSVKASIVLDKCLNKFPVDTNLWETCFRIVVEYYLKNNLPLKDLEPLLKKYMDKDITAMASAIMFSNDCVQHSELFTPMFYLNICSKLMDTWG